MAEYIEREAVLKLKRKMNGADFGGEFWDEAVLCEDIRNIPAADVVSREVFEQVRWERDTALQTLQEHGIGLGQKADVVEVKHGEWVEVKQIGRNSRHIQYTTKQCSVCGYWNGRKKTNYCPHCGAKMDLKEGAEE